MRLRREDAINTSFVVVGLPNVGKTLLINVLRSCGFSSARSSSNKYVNVSHKIEKWKIMSEPGTTGAVQEKVRVSNNPIVYATDTPGIFHDRYPSLSEITKLTLTN